MKIIGRITLPETNIAKGNPPFEDVCPIKKLWFSIAMLVYQSVVHDVFSYLKMKDAEWFSGWFLWDVFIWMATGESIIIRQYIEESFSILAPECCLI